MLGFVLMFSTLWTTSCLNPFGHTLAPNKDSGVGHAGSFLLRELAGDEPTSVPTFVPTSSPTTCANRADYCALVGGNARVTTANYCEDQFCPTCPEAHLCDFTCGLCEQPTPLPTPLPTSEPTAPPSPIPTTFPSQAPSPIPSPEPTSRPTMLPSLIPSPKPTAAPTFKPTPEPTTLPSEEPTAVPIPNPTPEPSLPPSPAPTSFPTPACSNSTAGLYALTLFSGSGDAGLAEGWGPSSSGVTLYEDPSAGGNAAFKWPGLDSGESETFRWVCLPDGCFTLFANISDAAAGLGATWTLVDQASPRVVHPTLSGASRDSFCLENGIFKNAPTLLPTMTYSPSPAPVPIPTAHPTFSPSELPTAQPTFLPTLTPSSQPTLMPTALPTAQPTDLPTPKPTPEPTFNPTAEPTLPPTPAPSARPSLQPTQSCGKGYYINGTVCLQCTPGRYSNTNTTPFPYMQCDLCPSGTIAEGPGSTECTACADGKFSSSDRLTCGTCPGGKFVNATLSECVSCSLGRYAPTAVNDNCILCGAGFATGAETGATACSSCAPGTYSAGKQQFCGTCPAGKQSGTRASACESCEAGTFAEFNNSASCQACDAGTSTNGKNGSAVCESCPAGTYSVTRASTCFKCEPGFYTEVPGLSSCRACAAGRFAENNRTTNCTLCKPGQYQGAAGQPSCVDCEVGKAVAEKEAKFCVNCATGYKSLEGWSTCAICEAGYYWGIMIDPDQAVTDDGYGCETCPANANCYAGSFLGDLLSPVAKDGYWIDYEAAVDDPTLLREVYKCPRDTCFQPAVTSETARRRLDGDGVQAKSLPGGTWSTEQSGGGDHSSSSSSSSSSAVVTGGSYTHGSGSPRPRRELNTNCLLLVNYNNPECQVDQTCEEGSYGPMCGACEAGWSYNAALRVCESCDTGAVYEQAFLVLGMGIVIAVVLWVMRTGEIMLPKFMHRRCGRTKVIVPLVGIITSVDSGAIKLLWSTFQIVMSVSFNLSVSFPEPFNALSRYLSFVQFDFLSLECLEGGYYWGVYVSSAFPLFLSIVCWTIWFLRFSIDSVLMLFDPEEGSKEIAKLWAEHMHAFLLIIYIFVPPIANIQFKSLDCQKLKDGQSYLRVDTEVDCNSDEYKSFVGVVGALIAIYQSLPLLYIFMLCRVRDKLNPQGVNPRVALELRDNDESLNAVNFLFKDYKCNRWYFEIADMYRRIIFIGVIPLLNSDGATRAYAGCALALLSTVYFRELTPYRVEFTNFLAVVAQYVILLAFMAALMISTNSLDRFNISDFALGLIMSFTNALIVAMAVYIGWRRYQKEQRDRAEHAAKLIKIEWAVHFSANKFNTTFEYVVQRSIPASHQMVFYYCSMSQAQDIILSGVIPATSRHGGIVVNLMGPQVIKANDPSLSLGLSGPPKVMASREAVLCMALPHTMLHEYPKHLLEYEEELYPEAAGASSKGPERWRSSTNKGAEKIVLPKEALASRADAAKTLRFIPGPILHAMAFYVAPEKAKISKKKRREMAKAKEKARKKADALAAAGNTAAAAEAKAAHDAEAAKEAAKRKEDDLAQRLRRAVVTLPSKVVVRAYQLVDQGTAPSIEPKELLRAPPPKMGPDNTPLPPIEVVQPKECSEYLAIMDEVRKECAQEGTVPLYHYTMVQIAPMIIRGGFRMSTQGQGDGGVYFSTLGPSSYELGADIYEENIIIDCFGKERLEEYRGKHKLDLLFVYGVHPSIVEQAPGGRENAKMVSKALFEDFANPSIDGNYFLRPDFIKAAILLDGTSGLPKGRDEALDGLDNEKVNDKLVQAQLNSTAGSLHVHSDLAKYAREIYLEKASESTAPPTAASVVSVWSKLRSTGSKSFGDVTSSAQKKEGGPQDSSPGDGSAAAFETQNTPSGRGSFQAAMIRAAKEEKSRREREATGESDAADARRLKNLLSVHEPAEGDEGGDSGAADPETATAGPESPPSPEEAPGVFASSSAALEAKI